MNDCVDSDIELFDFIPGNVDFAGTPKLLGRLISFRKTNSFRSPFDPYCMALANDGNIWITDAHEIVECNPHERMEIVRRTECECQEIRCSTSSEIFVLTGHEVMKIHDSGRLNNIHNFAPYQPTTFHVSGGNELIVIMESNERNSSKIVILTMDGMIKQEYNFTDFAIIDCSSIVKTTDGSFCLSSQKTLGNSLRTVKMINTNREVIWEYPSNSSEEVTIDNFWPSEITESREGNIIMTEVLSSALHILDKAGQVLKIVSTLQFGIRNPALIASDCNGNLWISGECYKLGNPILCNMEISGF